ncbi:hypothetical protein QJS66_03710 [Kocuria rhizophila]|nr:hypothetical protein QJS66_03710 [Kocuria rhizophila]
MYQRYAGSRGPASRLSRSGSTTPPPTVAHENGTSSTRPGTATSPSGTRAPGILRRTPDWTGPANPRWAAKPGWAADREVVWTWAPYQEDHSRGKDRRDRGTARSTCCASRRPPRTTTPPATTTPRTWTWEWAAGPFRASLGGADRPDHPGAAGGRAA